MHYENFDTSGKRILLRSADRAGHKTLLERARHVLRDACYGARAAGGLRSRRQPATLLHEHAQKRREFAHKIVEDVFRALRKKFPSSVIHKDVRIGCPKEVILSTAEKWHADAIVVGSHGKSKLGRMMMGSVSSSILADAKCTVIVVRPPAVVAAPKRRADAQKVTV